MESKGEGSLGSKAIGQVQDFSAAEESDAGSSQVALRMGTKEGGTVTP